MVITTTSAAALAAGSGVGGLPAAEREPAMVMLTLGQLPDRAGVSAQGDVSLTKAVYVGLHPGETGVTLR